MTLAIAATAEAQDIPDLEALASLNESTRELIEEIRMEGRVKGVEGRKVFAEGRMWHGDTLLAEAEGIFIKFDEAHRSRLVEGGHGNSLASGAGKSR